jgi:alkyldihydroxyacetonephosphate synthase
LPAVTADADTTLGPGAPTPPIAIAGGAAGATSRLDVELAVVGDALLDRLRSTGADVITDAEPVAEASRDWWPGAMIWATDGQIPVRGAALVRPTSAEQVAAVLKECNGAGVPVTPAAGRSGVCGASIPVHGGIVLDLCGLSGIVGVDDASLTVEVLPGTFGDLFEDELQRTHGLTVGHWPQSMALSTVGGWLACRGAGQYSTRYGKIEDIVVGLEVALADGRIVRTGGAPRAAVGPDLNQVFVGSEGTLGVITRAWLKAHPVPTEDVRLAFGFPSFEAGLDACRRILRRGATPAVLRLYDDIEGQRNFETGDGTHPLLVLDEGDPALIAAVAQVVAEECADAAPLDVELLDRWLDHRNDVSKLEELISGGLVVDTMEVAGPWGDLDAIYADALAAIRAVPGTLAASCHQSHAYTDGACLYFTFAGKTPTPEERDRFYADVWEAGTRAVLAAGGALSHHHGVGLNRTRFVADALGSGFDVLVALKRALDPNGVMNPGKLGLPDPYGAVPWP